MNIKAKRVYEKAEASDGFRVLVDRLWPRGVSKDKAKIDLWLKEVGPSDELRKWFNHDSAKFEEFSGKYKQELASNSAFKQLEDVARENKVVTLVYSAKDEERNQAVVLCHLLA